MVSELLKQVRILDPVSQTDRVSDVLIGDGVIQAIAPAISSYPAETIVHDCKEWVLGPGLVDLYSHSSEPGHEERETLRSLLQAGAAGGFTRLAILPDTTPAIDDPAIVAWLHEKNQYFYSPVPTPDSPLPTLLCWAALTVDVQGKQMTELAELAATEIVGFADGRSLQNQRLQQRLLEYLQPLGKPVALWAWDADLAGNGVMREGPESMRFGLPGVPAIAETAPLSALLECIEATNTPVHLMRISTARGVELIQAAKSRGLPITASTTWMHLLLNSADVGSYDPNLRLNPPLGNPIDQAALNRAVRDGVLDTIAIDHAPYTYEEKTVAFAEAPSGAIGLELALPLLWHQLVATRAWSALELWSALSTQPSACLQQAPATIATNQPAELTLFDPTVLWSVEGKSLKSQATNTPWFGKKIQGKVLRTWNPKDCGLNNLRRLG